MSEPRPINLQPTPAKAKPKPSNPPVDIAVPAAPQVAPVQMAPATTAQVPATVTPTRVYSAEAQRPLSLTEISNLGSQTLAKTAQVSGKITEVAKLGDMDELGKIVGTLLVKAKEYDPTKLNKGGFFGWFRRSKQQLVNHYSTVDSSVNNLVGEIDKRVGFFRGRVDDLKAMFDANEEYHDELGQTIADLEERIAWSKDNAPVVDENDPFSAQRAADWQQAIVFAEKRVDDLKRGQMLSQQTGPQIKLMAMNSIALSQTFDDIKVTTIPTMQRTFALYIINQEQQQGADMAEAVRDANNAAIRKNADLLKTNTTKINTQLTRSNIDMATLVHNQKAVFDSLAEVERIRNDMKTRLAAEAPQIEKLSADLHKRMAEYGQTLPGQKSVKQISSTPTF